MRNEIHKNKVTWKQWKQGTKDREKLTDRKNGFKSNHYEINRTCLLNNKTTKKMNKKKAIRNERTNEIKLTILNDAYNDSILISDMYIKHVANDRITPNNVILFNGNFFKKQIDISLWNLTEFISQNYLNDNQ